MKTPALFFTVTCLFLAGCYPDSTDEPKWIADLMPKLRCGMELEDIRSLTTRKVHELEYEHWFLGSHYISTAWYDLSFRFDDGGGLEAVTWGAAENSKTLRYSPRTNLCTGRIDFYLWVTWTYDYVGADVFLDGAYVDQEERPWPYLELPSGPHELRIEVEDFQPVIRRFDFGENDRGDQWLELTEKDLYPLTTGA